MTARMALPEGARGRALALGCTVLAAALVWLGVAAPLVDWYMARADLLEQRRAIAARMATLAATRPALERALATPTVHASRALADSATDALASAALQQLVADMAARAKVDIGSVETLAGEPAGAYRRIRLHLSVHAALPPLVHLLTAIEQSDLSMLIDDLEIHPPDGRGDVAAILDARFTVIAFREPSVPRLAPSASP